jgi:hypothetical protein
MGDLVSRLTGLVEAENRYDIPSGELREAQIAAINERFQERKARSNWWRIAPPRRASRGAQPRGRGEAAVAAHRLQELSRELAGAEALGPFVQMAGYGLHVSRTGGQSVGRRRGRRLDRQARRERLLRVLLQRHDREIRDAGRLAEGYGLVQERRRSPPIPGARASSPRRIGAYSAWRRSRTCRATSRPARPTRRRCRTRTTSAFIYPVPPITVGALTQMVVLRKSIADGTAKPETSPLSRKSRRRARRRSMTRWASPRRQWWKRVAASCTSPACGRVSTMLPRPCVRLGYSAKDFIRRTRSMSAAASSAPSCRRLSRVRL